VNSESELSAVLHDIDTRLRIVESDLTRMAGMRKILLGVSIGLVMQAIAGGIAYGQLVQSVEQMNTNPHVETLIRLQEEDIRLRDLLLDATKSRFYREDAYPIYERLNQIEKRIERNEGYIFGPVGASE
jgi:tetrahydromethanopterin S-methyltransferase subunit G